MTGINAAGATAPPTPMDPLLLACLAAQRRHALFGGTPTQPQVVVVAVSGGADSVALLHVLCQLQTQWGLLLHVAHLDHNLRPESVADAHFVAQLAAQWHIPFHGHQLPLGSLAAGVDGVEAAGRAARYHFLAEVAVTVTPPTQPPVIALGHHADDQAETVLFRLVRGSGVQGLGGMRWVAPRPLGELWPTAPLEKRAQPIRLVRPFLGVQRADLLRYLRTHQLAWREDKTNVDQRFARNRLRHTVLPALAALNPKAVATLARSAQLFQAEAERLALVDQTLLSTLLREPAWSLAQIQAGLAQRYDPAQALERVLLDLERLTAFPRAAQRGILRAAIALLLGPALLPSFEQLDGFTLALQPPHQTSGPHPLLADLAWSLRGPVAATPACLSLHRQMALPFSPEEPWLADAWRQQVGTFALPEGGKVAVGQGWSLCVERLSSAELPADWRQRCGPWQVYLDATQSGRPVLTTPQPGDRYAPLGLQGHHQSIGDFFTDRKIPPALRSGWPLIVDASHGVVLWVGGYQPSHTAQITAHTQAVLGLRWEQEADGC
ncbi:MAG: tRNA lysidine(34) synthetase TilS [Caldilineaceae bacterium]|nr:tRNA lysidine(34) synthetase TilS [Caldilineaceae bacterium]